MFKVLSRLDSIAIKMFKKRKKYCRRVGRGRQLWLSGRTRKRRKNTKRSRVRCPDRENLQKMLLETFLAREKEKLWRSQITVI
jgi:hypothetical protein